MFIGSRFIFFYLRNLKPMMDVIVGLRRLVWRDSIIIRWGVADSNPFIIYKDGM